MKISAMYNAPMNTSSNVSATFILQFEEPHTIVDAAVDCGTQTMTLTKEESDQDRGAHPRIICGTETGTRTKEEPDQDLRHEGYFAIPRA